MLKKLLMNLAVVMFFISFTNISLASTPNIYIGDVVRHDDEEVTMDLHLENVESNVAKLNFKVNFDASKLEYIGSTASKEMKTTVKISESSTEDGVISIGITTPAGMKCDGIYYQLNFKVLDTSVEEIPVQLELKNVTNAKRTNSKM